MHRRKLLRSCSCDRARASCRSCPKPASYGLRAGLAIALVHEVLGAGHCGNRGLPRRCRNTEFPISCFAFEELASIAIFRGSNLCCCKVWKCFGHSWHTRRRDRLCRILISADPQSTGERFTSKGQFDLDDHHGYCSVPTCRGPLEGFWARRRAGRNSSTVAWLSGRRSIGCCHAIGPQSRPGLVQLLPPLPLL
jgi:hypothetical protein